MTKQEHCTALLVLAYFYWYDGDKLNAEGAINTALDIANYPWYIERNK